MLLSGGGAESGGIDFDDDALVGSLVERRDWRRNLNDGSVVRHRAHAIWGLFLKNVDHLVGPAVREFPVSCSPYFDSHLVPVPAAFFLPAPFTFPLKDRFPAFESPRARRASEELI